MADSPLKRLTESERRLLTTSAPPRGSRAMKATLSREVFSEPGWIYERKLDGIRCIGVRDGAEVRLLSRNDLSLNERYPEIAQAIRAQPHERFAVDGEVVAFKGSATSFAALAQRGRRRVPVFLYAFDLIWLDGHDLTALPLSARKRLLRGALTFDGPLRLTTHRTSDAHELFRVACRQGWEGLIAKRADSPYAAARSRDWLKFKCEQGQELVIGGYTAPQGSRIEFGALLLGYHDGDELRYAGKVGTGFDETTLRELGGELRRRRRTRSPFADPIRERQVTWVQPELVAQVAFTEWTQYGRLRHPRFLGLRDDKAAGQVVRER